MMSKEKQEFHMSIGAPSIFMLFVVLVMLILATLASLRAHSYYESTLRQMNLTKQYYQAQSHLLTVYEQLEPKDIEQQLKSKNIHYIYQNQKYYLIDSINEDQDLKLTFQGQDENLHIVSFQTENKEVEDGN